MEKANLKYKPLEFIAITFLLSWVCAFFKAYQTWFSYSDGTALSWAMLSLADFLESASPLIAAFILWRKPLFKEGWILRFIFGNRPRILPYIIVTVLFIYQFLTFYLFGLSNGTISVTAFLAAWGGQILFGGGMEEGGWRGYLQPYFEKKLNIIVSVLAVGIIWALWHLPYFFMPGNMHTGGNFLMYTVTATATAFTLTAIYKLTGSIMLCILFHGWQNAIVMNIPSNMSHAGFLAMFALQTIVSIIFCLKPIGAEKQEK